MRQTKRSYLRMGGLVLALLLALSALATLAGASTTTRPIRASLAAPAAAISNPAAMCDNSIAGQLSCDLYAVTGTVSMPDGVVVPIWGYSESAAPGLAQLPGPTIIANEGDNVTVNLTNNLAVDTALIFPGQAMIPDMVGAAANGGTASYTFVASNPGTYLYEAGLLPEAARQVAMGMSGALVVRPASGIAHAYDAASPFDLEELVVLNEIDVNLNADPANFDMRDFNPQYRLINGKAFPETNDIVAAAGNRVLLRYINAGIQQHTMGVLGMDQELIARDGSLRPYPQRELSESIGPGRTADAIVTLPSPAPAGGASYALYDSSVLLHNNGVGFGGMLTFLTVPDGAATGTGPTTVSVSLNPASSDGSVPVALSATIPGASSAEYFINDTQGTATAMMAGPGPNEWTASIDVSLMSTGVYIVYVHGSDGTTWGAFNVALMHLDKDGPVTSGITFFPNPSAGDVSIDVSATGNDTSTGGSNIMAAEYYIDDNTATGTAMPMTVNVAEPIASLDASIDAATMNGLTEGIHTIYIRSMDSMNHWGGFASATIDVDKSGPATSSVVVHPSPNDGSIPYNPSVFAIRVDAVLADALSNGVNSTILRAEGYFNSPDPGVGMGFPLSPRDGLYDESIEEAYAYIPMPTVIGLGVGTHQIWVRAQDASGNWGTAVPVDLVIIP